MAKVFQMRPQREKELTVDKLETLEDVILYCTAHEAKIEERWKNQGKTNESHSAGNLVHGLRITALEKRLVAFTTVAALLGSTVGYWAPRIFGG